MDAANQKEGGVVKVQVVMGAHLYGHLSRSAIQQGKTRPKVIREAIADHLGLPLTYTMTPRENQNYNEHMQEELFDWSEQAQEADEHAQPENASGVRHPCVTNTEGCGCQG